MTTLNPAMVLRTPLQDPYCEHLVNPSWLMSGLSLVLVVGILGSYLPQHAKIVRHQTSAGLSPWWVLLGTLSSTCAIANIIVLPTSQHDMACCSEISAWECTSSLLGMVQIGVQWTCFTGIMILFLIFFPRETPAHVEGQPAPVVPRARDAIIVGVISLLTILSVGLISIVFLTRMPALLLVWANVLGVTASILSSVQYIPQLYTTWRLKHIFSLSIATMLVQVPGSFIFAFSLWYRVGWQGWSAWAVYCVSGTLQGGLLAMALYFRSQELKESQSSNKSNRTTDGTDEHDASETSPLIPRANGTANGSS